MWCNYTGWKSQEERPNRVRLADGTTRSNEEVTDQMLADAGWFWEEPVQVVIEQDLSTSTNYVSP